MGKHEILTECVAHHFGLTVQQIRGKGRTRYVVRARKMVCELIREYCVDPELSLQDIGNYLSGRDSSTILHSLKEMPPLSGMELRIKKLVVRAVVRDGRWYQQACVPTQTLEDSTSSSCFKKSTEDASETQPSAKATATT